MLVMEPTSKIEARLNIEPNGKVQRFLTHACIIHMNKYLPFDTGTLATTYEEQPDKVIYQQPYAKVVYYGVRNGKDLHYQTDKHPLAGPYWDQEMVSAEIDDVCEEVQKYMENVK